jgi:hypothetical protein
MYTVATNIKCFFLIIITLLPLLSCSNENKKEKTLKYSESASDGLNKELKDKIEKTLFEMPSPIDVVSHVRSSELNYRKELLNDPSKYVNYQSSNLKKALNLGVYMTNLGYTCLYFKAQDAIAYLQACKNLTEDMGIWGAFETSIARRFESNLNNRDSLISIVRESIYLTDQYLHENERYHIATMVLTGSYIEGLFISTQTVKGRIDDEKVKPVIWRIGEQKQSLASLISLIEEMNISEMDSILKELQDLATIYEPVIITKNEENEFIDITEVNDIGEVTDLTVINGLGQVKISAETLIAITQKAESIRNAIIQ